jgi:hypothetical protein
MDVSEIIKTTLQPLNLPVEADKYSGSATEFVVWNYLDERPIYHAGNTDLLDGTNVRVNYYTKGKVEVKKKAIRRLLRLSGFLINSTSQFYESDTGYRQVAIDAFMLGEIND